MKKILVVVDMQKDFIDGALGTKEAVEIVPKVVAKIKTYKEQGCTIYFTKDTHDIDYLHTQEGKNLPVEHCIKGREGWELEKEISKLAQEIEEIQKVPTLFEKGSFGSIALAEAIQKEGIDEEEVVIEVIGVCTDICVLSNVMLLKAYLPEAKIVVDESCCAGVTPESHLNALNALKMCQIHIIS